MVVYVCSRYRSDDAEEFALFMQYTRDVSREVVASGHDVIVPHLYYPQFLDDNDPDEREAGMKSALRLLDVCDAILINTKYRISEGMEAEIEYAKKKDIKILKADSVEAVKTLMEYQ